MYKYDEIDQALVDARVDEFKDQVERRVTGTLSEEEFRPLRLQNGLYLQRHAYMLRVAIPYGVLNADQLDQLAYIARRYDKGYGHFTTRQNIQFSWLTLEDSPAILADLAKVQMHAIQTSGNCIRNVTADHFAGAAADELEDPQVLRHAGELQQRRLVKRIRIAVLRIRALLVLPANPVGKLFYFVVCHSRSLNFIYAGRMLLAIRGVFLHAPILHSSLIRRLTLLRDLSLETIMISSMDGLYPYFCHHISITR